MTGEPRRPAIDEIGLNKPQLFIGNAQGKRRQSPHVVNHHIGIFNKLGHNLLPSSLLEVYRDAAFIAVEIGETRTDICARARPHCTKTIAL